MRSSSVVIALLLLALEAQAQSVSGSLDVRWSNGEADCNASKAPPLQLHRFEPHTYILRQELCLHFEAPFLYLLIGTKKALLIDTGAIEDPARMPLAKTVMELLRVEGRSGLPLIVVHSHGHGDHKAGDRQFAGMKSVTMVAAEVDAIRRFFRFEHWPSGVAQLDLGERTVHVLPAPGHQAAHLVFYDERTSALFTGDFLLPGRLLVEDRNAYVRSARRVADFVMERPVSHVLGAHIELDASGSMVVIGSRHHPDERHLELRKEAVLELPAALEAFTGSVARHRDFVIMNR